MITTSKTDLNGTPRVLQVLRDSVSDHKICWPFGVILLIQKHSFYLERQ